MAAARPGLGSRPHGRDLRLSVQAGSLPSAMVPDTLSSASSVTCHNTFPAELQASPKGLQLRR